MSVSDMLKSIAVSSANDCACAMAEHLYGSESAFVEKMNARAAELGMNDTHFVNCTGLDDDPEAENHKTSAYDIALMSRELMKNHPDIKNYTTIWMDTVRGGSFGLSNTNKMVRFYNGCTGLRHGVGSGSNGRREFPGPICGLQAAAGLWLCQLCVDPTGGAGVYGAGAFRYGK